MIAPSSQEDQRSFLIPWPFHVKSLRYSCSIILTLLCVLGLGACQSSQETNPPPSVKPASEAQSLSDAERISIDAQHLVHFLEQVHPYFIEDADEAYELQRDGYLEQAKRPMSADAFFLLSSAYLSFLDDAHTCLFTFQEEALPIAWVWRDDALVVPADAKTPYDRYVLEIGGVLVSEIANFVDEHFPAETEFARLWNRQIYSRYRFVLEALDAQYGADGLSIVMGRINGDKDRETMQLYYEELGITPQNSYDIPDDYPDQNFRLQMLEEDSIAYLQTRQCVFDASHSQAVSDLEAALERGVKKVIIDVRYNSGGNSGVWRAFMALLGMQGKEPEVLIRNSTVLREQMLQRYERIPISNAEERKLLKGNISLYESMGEYMRTQSNDTIISNPDIQLIVLAGERTYSAAMTLVVAVHDSKLGTVIGNGIRNAPSCYTDAISFTLPTTHFSGSVSHKKVTRPSPELDEIGDLGLDIEIPLGEDALQVALELLRNEGE